MEAPGELFDELVRAHRLRWTHSDELLALAVEKLDELHITLARIFSDPKKIGRPPKPFRYPRPHLRTRRRRGSTPEEIRRFFRGR